MTKDHMPEYIIVILAALGVFTYGVFLYTSDDRPSKQYGQNDILDYMEDMTISSSAFKHNTSIPEVYSCDGENTNPPLSFGNVPAEAKSLALIVDDPDIPDVVKNSRMIEKFDHWVLYNIPASETEITSPYAGGGVHGKNSRGDSQYTGPCPPTEHEPTEHRYIFQLYALDTELDLPEGATEAELRSAMKGHILSKAELIGLFDRANSN